jgi:hypothetical protein
MTARETEIECKRVMGMFSEPLDVSDVQEADRLTASAITHIGEDGRSSARALTTSQESGPQTDVGNMSLLGFGRSKSRFVCAAISGFRRSTSMLIAAHPNLALPAACAKYSSP